MKRRSFIKGMLPMAMAPLALNGIPVSVMGRNLMSSFTCEEVNDRALVLIQLHGGNDGLNTIIPLEQYNIYKNLRPIIGIEDTGIRKYIDVDSSLSTQDQIGLHPDMGAVKSLYDDGKVNIVQNVSYTNNNGSHFRGTDIWLTGKDGDTIAEHPDSGWWGRYLDHKFPNFPAAYPNPDMEDPLGLEFGSHIVSLGFHRQAGIPTGMTLGNDPSGLYNEVSGVGGALPTNFPASDYGTELEYLVEMERSTNVYAQRISDLYNAGSNTPSVVYPEVYHTYTTNAYNNQLSGQLKTVARLMSAGCKTKVYLVRMGGFDTHSNQSIADKPSFGGHGALLYHLSEAVKAFQDDLAGLGLEDNVLTMTFSEFGRQVAENGTWGTDHGTTAPMMIFGKGVTPGVTGTNPNLSNLVNNKLQGFEHDYRQVVVTVLQDWLGANNGSLDVAEMYDWSNKKLDLINSSYIDGSGNTINWVADTSCDSTPDLPDLPPDGTTRIDPELKAKLQFKVFPNPATDYIEVSLNSEQMMPASIGIFSLDGKKVKEVSIRLFAGPNSERIDVANLSSGTYIVRLVANKGSRVSSKLLGSKKLVIQ